VCTAREGAIWAQRCDSWLLAEYALSSNCAASRPKEIRRGLISMLVDGGLDVQVRALPPHCWVLRRRSCWYSRTLPTYS
jgi:hypothetical protein